MKEYCMGGGGGDIILPFSVEGSSWSKLLHAFHKVKQQVYLGFIDEAWVHLIHRGYKTAADCLPFCLLAWGVVATIGYLKHLICG